MSAESKPSAAITLPGQGRVFRALGDEITILLDGEQTGGTLMMGVLVTAPGGGPPPHYHLHEDEWFIVQEGRVSFFASDHWQEVPVGTTVFIPRTVVHTFQNLGDKPCRMLIGASPAGTTRTAHPAADAGEGAHAARDWKIGSRRWMGRWRTKLNPARPP